MLLWKKRKKSFAAAETDLVCNHVDGESNCILLQHLFAKLKDEDAVLLLENLLSKLVNVHKIFSFFLPCF